MCLASPKLQAISVLWSQFSVRSSLFCVLFRLHKLMLKLPLPLPLQLETQHKMLQSEALNAPWALLYFFFPFRCSSILFATMQHNDSNDSWPSKGISIKNYDNQRDESTI